MYVWTWCSYCNGSRRLLISLLLLLGAKKTVQGEEEWRRRGWIRSMIYGDKKGLWTVSSPVQQQLNGSPPNLPNPSCHGPVSVSQYGQQGSGHVQHEDIISTNVWTQTSALMRWLTRKMHAGRTAIRKMDDHQRLSMADGSVLIKEKRQRMVKRRSSGVHLLQSILFDTRFLVNWNERRSNWKGIKILTHSWASFDSFSFYWQWTDEGEEV